MITVSDAVSRGRTGSMTESVDQASPVPPGMLFDLDGTLLDRVYQHVLAWQQALTAFGIDLSVWKIHRRIGMSGGLFVTALLRETGGALSADEIQALNLAHTEAYGQRRDTVRPLPGARDLLTTLTDHRVPWAIATSGLAIAARPALQLLGLPPDTPLITRDEVRFAKPDPDLFLAAAARVDTDIRTAVVVGDSIWDLLAARRAGALGIGLLSGGYGREELERAGAYRVYADPADLLLHLDEVGVRRDAR
jgi:HAD superfamily hydrolase (TIGR01509 family)